ncbi:Phosphoglucomutase [bioreactor metagenome]|uniref:Phosphoglucomutase n=1 Tax=bioreactor metagenome TaxID=1076179 RepID=A0A644XAJ5_9ZZZZ
MAYRESYEKWLNSPSLSGTEKEELLSVSQNDKEIESRFFGPLEFGTAGLRGTMGIGLNRMNPYVIRHATQAFADVILAEGPARTEKGIGICFDCRNHSEEYAHEAARVMAANNIPVRLFEALRPTPELSFAIRHYSLIAGINITASHNPKEYNGYKVYWEDGAQLPPHHADAIAERMTQLDVFDGVKTMDYNEAIHSGLITFMGKETDEAFLSQVMAQVNDTAVVAKVADSFKMVYTPFHGTGYQLVPKVLENLGIKHLYCVPEQMVIDGNFPTVVSPNPENPEGFALAVELAKRVGADFILGTDPDADRVGIMVRDSSGAYVTISGNQTGVLLLDYLIGAKRRAGTLPPNAAALKTIVTTEMARKVSEVNGVKCFDTFTGFKFMAEKKNALEETGEGKVIFSYEESYGYMVGDYVRDKDAVTASLLLTEMAAWYASQGMTLFEALSALYRKYGFYGERTLNLVMPGLDGLAKMKALMAGLRAQPPALIDGVKVETRRDYQSGILTETDTGKVSEMELSGSNVLKYHMADGTDLIVRPSGTEPKVKVYILAAGRDRTECDRKVATYTAWADTLKK